MGEYVVLVNDKNEVIGTLPKLEAHNSNTPLHRGFSVFLFNQKGEVLLQQRGKNKKTWPLVWSNSCCGHPKLEESVIDAAKRRLKFELGITNVKIHVLLPDYRYTCEKDGIVENEICPVMIGFTHQSPKINRDEVEAIKWISWQDWIQEVKNNSENYSQWSVEETQLLEKNKTFRKLFSNMQPENFLTNTTTAPAKTK